MAHKIEIEVEGDMKMLSVFGLKPISDTSGSKWHDTWILFMARFYGGKRSTRAPWLSQAISSVKVSKSVNLPVKKDTFEK